MSTHPFDRLNSRQQYGSNRRAALISKLCKKGESLEWVYSFEAGLERYLKRRLGFSDWDSNWDAGLYLDNDKTYVTLSRANDLGSFQILEKVEYHDELKPITWLSDCLKRYKK